MRNLKRQTIDKKSVHCPQCNKLRMIRPLDHVVDKSKTEFKTRDDQSIMLYTDVCQHCQDKNFRKHFQPSKSDLKKLLKSINTEEAVDDENSLEDVV